MINIAILASGSGTNTENMIRYFVKSETIKIALVLSNNSTAGVLLRAEAQGVPSFTFSRSEFQSGETVLRKLHQFQIDYLILAGFLNKIPEIILQAYPGRIINIHPALLPKFGGKGMYGHFVHGAVLQAGESESGITIHQIDAQYDEGAVLFQATCPVLETDTPETLAARVHELEYFHYPRVIEALLTNSD